MAWRSSSDVIRNALKAWADDTGRRAASESDRPLRVKTGSLVEGDIVVIISVDISISQGTDDCSAMKSFDWSLDMTRIQACS